jgi:hypothetical protein
LVPPIRSKFLYMNETWVTIGWAKRACDNRTYVWCGLDDATHVIAKHADSLTNWVGPIADIGPASRTGGGNTIAPTFLSTKASEKQTKKLAGTFAYLTVRSASRQPTMNCRRPACRAIPVFDRLHRRQKVTDAVLYPRSCRAQRRGLAIAPFGGSKRYAGEAPGPQQQWYLIQRSHRRGRRHDLSACLRNGARGHHIQAALRALPDWVKVKNPQTTVERRGRGSAGAAKSCPTTRPLA